MGAVLTNANTYENEISHIIIRLLKWPGVDEHEHIRESNIPYYNPIIKWALCSRT
jgi:hypothetical protein